MYNNLQPVAEQASSGRATPAGLFNKSNQVQPVPQSSITNLLHSLVLAYSETLCQYSLPRLAQIVLSYSIF
jgi:hypothetical protein